MLPQNDVIADDYRWAFGGYRPREAVLTPSLINIHFLRPMCQFKITPTERGGKGRLSFKTDRKSCLSLLPVMGNYAYRIDEEKNEIIGVIDGHSMDDAKNFNMYFVLRFPDGAPTMLWILQEPN